MTSASTSYRTRSATGTRRLVLVTLLAALAAALVNTVAYLVGHSLGAFPRDVIIPADMPMTLLPIVSVTIIATLAAGAEYALLGRLTRRPTRAFLILAVVARTRFAAPR